MSREMFEAIDFNVPFHMKMECTLFLPSHTSSMISSMSVNVCSNAHLTLFLFIIIFHRTFISLSSIYLCPFKIGVFDTAIG